MMLAVDYDGETKGINLLLGVVLRSDGWAFILFDIFAGESANAFA